MLFLKIDTPQRSMAIKGGLLRALHSKAHTYAFCFAMLPLHYTLQAQSSFLTIAADIAVIFYSYQPLQTNGLPILLLSILAHPLVTVLSIWT